MRFYSILLALLTLAFSNKLYSDEFVLEKRCPFFTMEYDKPKKLGYLENQNDLNKFSFKSYLRSNGSNYVLISRDGKDYLIKQNCGYRVLQEIPKLQPLFENKEITEGLNNADDFDKEILKVCGYPGSHPPRSAIRNVLIDERFRKNFNEIYSNLGGSIFTKTDDKEVFLSELLDVLFDSNGFKHVFCGSFKEGKLSGLHYYYRYLELDQNGFIGQNSSKKCLNSINKANQNTNKARSISIDFVDLDGKVFSKCVNGYSQVLNATSFFSYIGMVGKINWNNNISNLDNSNNHYLDNRNLINKSCIYRDTENDLMINLIFSKDKNSLITAYPITYNKCAKQNKGNESSCFCSMLDLTEATN
jgi:hypothetical protein